MAVAGCSSDPGRSDEGLPYHYYLVTRPSGELQRGFGVAQLELQGNRVRTRFGHVVSLDDLEEAKPARALGVERLGVAWVVERGAGVWAQADDSQPPIARKAPLERVVLDSRPAPFGWRAVREGFMRDSELRVPTLATRPTEVQPGERWIDVDTRSQSLAVYDGDLPRFITLISTGSGRPGTRFATPRGVHRINYKVPAATMDNLDEPPSVSGIPHYFFEEVPWVQYFFKEVAIHGAYWHQRFGHAVSHGCVNLAPADAQRVFAMTRASTPAYGGTVVRVR
jgi:lipoprotein-anchoring transpeptidase ErfK/SrfK